MVSYVGKPDGDQPPAAGFRRGTPRRRFQRATVIASLCAAAAVNAPRPGAACTSILVGCDASQDGSVMTSHTCDSHRTGSRIEIVPRREHAPGSELLLTRRIDDDSGLMPRYGRAPTGSIPQVSQTWGYLAPAYAAMNEFQVAIGESTFGGRPGLQSDQGKIDCETLTRLMLERATTAREAIQHGGQLIEQHGWCDAGEALTIADPGEVWLMEIVGPGPGRVGGVWAAQRIPDDHVSVVANASRIGTIQLDDTEHYLASPDVTRFAQEMGFWDPEAGPFRFYEAYHPQGRTSLPATRREWRVLSLLAPSLQLDPHQDVFPLSVKPDEPVGPERIMALFRDTYEGTEFDMVKDLTVADEAGRSVKSPLANPFMPYDMNRLLRINGGWGWRGERTLARWYCMYATVTQSRAWLPHPVGGIVWFGYGNPAMTTYAPLFAGIHNVPEDYQRDGRTTGFSRRAAWWGAHRAATLAAHRWGEMRHDVAEVRDPLQEKWFAKQHEITERVLPIMASDPAHARDILTLESCLSCREITDAYWNLGDLLWTKYNEAW